MVGSFSYICMNNLAQHFGDCIAKALGLLEFCTMPAIKLFLVHYYLKLTYHLTEYHSDMMTRHTRTRHVYKTIAASVLFNAK